MDKLLHNIYVVIVFLLTWENGRELKTYTDTNLTINYEYNIDGIRTAKTVNGTKTEYYLENSNMILEKTGNNVIYYIRDEKGDAIGFTYNNTKYYYKKNFQGDVLGIYDSNYNLIVNYTYDSWGKLISITDSNNNVITDITNIGYINPIRYRSYYYDSETKLYYLNSRYYNPEWGRFINCDSSLNNDILGNNPISRNDILGFGWWVPACTIVGGLISASAKIISNKSSGKKWNEGVVGAFASGAVSGFMASTGIGALAAPYVSAATESIVNEAMSYNKFTAKINGSEYRELSRNNVIDSVTNVAIDTAVNGTIGQLTGEFGDKIANIPQNNNWIQPSKFSTSFTGNYALRTDISNIVSSTMDNIVSSIFSPIDPNLFLILQEKTVSIFD